MKKNELDNRIKELELELSILKSGILAGTLEKEISFRQAIEKSIPSGITVMDDTGKQVYVNKSFCKMVGWSEYELLEKHPPYAYWCEHEIENNNNAFLQALNNNAPNEGFDLIFCHKNGKPISVQVIISPIIHENNKTFWLANVIDITARKLVEETLAYEKHRLSNILAGADVGTWEWNIQTGEIIFNEKWAELIGYSLEEISPVGIDTWTKYSHPEDLKVSKGLFEKYFKSGLDYYECATRMMHKNGDWVWILDRGRVHKWDEEGNPTLMSGTCADITEHKKTEEKLLFINKAVESISDAIAISDITGHHFYQNKAFSDLFEYATSEELEAVGGGTMIVKDQETAKEIFGNIMNDKSWAGELEMITRSGRTFPAFVRADVIKNSQGKIIGFINVITNISEYKQVELALKKSETKFKEIINQINDGIFVYDEHGKIIVWNRGAEKISGLKAVDIINKDVVDIQYQISSLALKDNGYIENIIKNVVIIQNSEVFNRTYDIEVEELNSGNFKNIQGIVFPIELNEYKLFCTVFRDTTEIKQYEKQLLQLNVDKDRFISILAHDLKSPFNSLLGLSEELAENIRQFDIDEIENLANTINKSAQSTYNLLEDLLMWARTQSGRILFEPHSLDFTDICKNILETLNPIADAKNISINYFAVEHLTVFADIRMLKTILRNLVSNAIKFTNKNGVININAKENSENVTISVSDSGIGIKPDSLTKLFDMSQTFTTVGTAKESGTGLGLLLCKEFVERHKGEIWVESEVGKGSNFIFTLPIFTQQANELNNNH